MTYTADAINGFNAVVTYDGEAGPPAIPFDAPAPAAQVVEPVIQEVRTPTVVSTPAVVSTPTVVRTPVVSQVAHAGHAVVRTPVISHAGHAVVRTPTVVHANPTVATDHATHRYNLNFRA